jgi:hypothetical protein
MEGVGASALSFCGWVGVETHWSGLSPTSFTRSAMAVEKKLSSLGLVRGKEKGTLEHRKEQGGGGRRRLVWLGYDGMGAVAWADSSRHRATG